VTLRGPVTRPSTVTCPGAGEWLAIRFRAGAFLSGLPAAALLNHQSLDLPLDGERHFWLQGSRWEIPGFENAEVFVSRLARCGVMKLDTTAQGAYEGDLQAIGLRSRQRHFLKTVGMTYARYRQIERARHAVQLLRAGRSIHDAVYEAGYFDQAHMTRAFKAFIGLSPLRVLRQEQQLSFLSKISRPPPR